MQKIPIRLAQPGMTLAQPLADAEGRMLMGAGVELTSGAIARLAATGVRCISVRGASAMEKSFWEFAESRLDHLFRKHTGDRFMAALKSMLSEHMKRHIASEKAGSDL